MAAPARSKVTSAPDCRKSAARAPHSVTPLPVEIVTFAIVSLFIRAGTAEPDLHRVQPTPSKNSTGTR
jgi:hypothetical protein